MKKALLLFFIVFTAIQCLQAQKPSKQMVDQTVNTIANLIKENYILPSKGDSIVDYFLNDHKKGRFYKAETLKKLDSIMTKSLREVSSDYHLYTWNNLEIVQQLQSEKEENQESETSNFFNNKDAYDANFGFEKVEILPDNIGYIKLTQINISTLSLKKLYAAMNLVENTNALVIDLRDNSGGGSTVGSVLETFFFDKYVDLLEFRTRKGKTDVNGTVQWLLEKRYLKPLYVLINKGTASAAEAFAFALKNQERCTLVGKPSSGGAYMNDYFLVNQDFIVAISTGAPFLLGTTKSWQGEGIQPDYLVESENALKKALEIIKSQELTNK